MPSVFPLFHLGQVGASPAGQVSPPEKALQTEGKEGPAVLCRDFATF